MLGAQDLSEQGWQTAHVMAQALVKQETDVNELGKAIAYLRASIGKPESGPRFFKYLGTLVRHGKEIGHSGRTLDYYRSIDEVCNAYLRSEQADPERMLLILGWTSRLMRYYREAGPIGELAGLPTELTRSAEVGVEIESERRAEIRAVTEAQTFELGQQLEAKVTRVKGKQVTYEILETIKLTVKEPKKAGDMTEGQIVTVEVTALKEDGGIKQVKAVSF